VTCGPLEGVLICLCKSLTGESLNMEARGSLDLHLGHEAHRLDDAPPLLGTTWMRDVAFGGFDYPLEVTRYPSQPQCLPLEAMLSHKL
jgi:hypothetical protein